MIRGRNAIEEFWDNVMKMGAKKAVLTTVELSGNGNALHELGTGVLTIHPEGQEPVEQRVKYVVVWKHTVDGWKYQWDIWNSI
jgi:ketosteroid isomerase-like protein